MESQTERQRVPVARAAVMVGVSKRTLYNWMADNLVEYHEGTNGIRLVYVDSLWRHPDCSKYPANTIDETDPARKRLVSIIKATEIVDVARRTLYNWIRDSKVTYVRTAGGSIRIVADSLWKDPLAAGNSTEPTGQPAQQARA